MKKRINVFVCAAVTLLMACAAPRAEAQEKELAMAVVRALDTRDSAVDTTVPAIAGAVTVRLADGASTVTTGGSAASVRIDNRSNSITITAAGTYALSGTLSRGSVVVDVDGNVNLILNGVNISSADGAPLALFGKQKKVITLAAGTQNTLTDAATYTRFYKDDEPNGALFSKNALTINGTGALTVTGRFNNGISCKDDLRIMSGNITVTAKNNAVKGNNSLVVKGGTLGVSSAKDGIKSDSEKDGQGWVYIEQARLTITAAEDGIQGYNAVHIVSGTMTINAGDDGVHADKVLVIDGGTITIPKSYEGLEAAKIVINGGDITLTSSDDGINAADGTGGDNFGGGRGAGPVPGGRGGRGGFAGGTPPAAPGGGMANSNCFIIIAGGKITVNAEGDGIDANGSALMTGGTLIVDGPVGRGNGALDSDAGFTVKGGLILAAGAVGMAQTPSTASTQYSAALTFRQVKATGTRVVVQDAAGKTIADYTFAKQFQSLIISAPAFARGGTYSVSVNGVKSSFTLGGLVTAVSI
ncbi:hypothetical protein FACS189461_2660 [Spirochaetia bacterium]|nr:hypothetical protein FACS189461_2660 [Spirochaetia bacterium]